MEGSKKSFRNIKLNMFFFFLLLSIVFWGLTKFSKENSAKITANLKYNNAPQNFLLSDENPESIDFDITSNGFDFLIYKMKQPSVTIDVSKYFDDGSQQAVVSNQLLKEEISKQINYNGDVRNLSREKLDIQLQGIQSKKVPVIVNAIISYSEGFRPIDSLAATPDSVVIAGPQRFLDSLSSVTTEELVVQNVSEDVSKKVQLVEIPYPQLSSNVENVTVKQKVLEFSQKKITVPLQMQNVPKNVTLKLIPNKINVNFIVPISQFSSITAADFEITCDYRERNTEENFLTPIVQKKPKSIKNVEINPKKIDFLIFKN